MKGEALISTTLPDRKFVASRVTEAESPKESLSVT